MKEGQDCSFDEMRTLGERLRKLAKPYVDACLDVIAENKSKVNVNDLTAAALLAPVWLIIDGLDNPESFDFLVPTLIRGIVMANKHMPKDITAVYLNQTFPNDKDAVQEFLNETPHD